MPTHHSESSTPSMALRPILARTRKPRARPHSYRSTTETVRTERIAGRELQPCRETRAHKAACDRIGEILREHLSCSLEQVYRPWHERPLCTENSVLFPDFWISLVEHNPTATRRLAYPGIVIDVISRSGRRHPRPDKTPLYRAVEGVDEILVVDIDRCRSHYYRRVGASEWQLTDLAASETVVLSGIALELVPLLQA